MFSSDDDGNVKGRDNVTRLRDWRKPWRGNRGYAASTGSRTTSSRVAPPRELPWQHRELPSYEDVMSAIDTQRVGLKSTRGVVIVVSAAAYEVLRTMGIQLHPQIVYADDTGSCVRYLVYGLEVWRDELAPPFMVRLQRLTR